MKKVIIASAIIALLIVVVRDNILNALVVFLFTGIVPGTNFAIPFWMMIAVYCLVITTIVTLYLEGALAFIKSRRQPSTSKNNLPKRRYNTI